MNNAEPRATANGATAEKFDSTVALPACATPPARAAAELGSQP